jgi:DNA transformation protein and related proteins
MAVTDDFIDFARDLLADFEPLRIKRMFGGAGIYSGELFFAILADDTMYLKVDDGNRAGFEKRGLQRFTYETKTGRTGTMSYYPVPSEAMDDPEALSTWARGALEAARRAAVTPATRKSRSSMKPGVR